MSVSTRNPGSSRLVRSVWILLACAGFLRAGQTLPVLLSDNHAETFGWITRTFDPDVPHRLVLVDAHSDASTAERSEEIREELRRVPSVQARGANVEKWRGQGRIQAFNWIEPLMPRPLDHVCWLAAPHLTETRRAGLHAEATGLLDGRLEVEPRSAGSFAGRWQTVDLTGFVEMKHTTQPVILAIDLDFFAGMEKGLREETFEAIWRTAMAWPRLVGVAFAVSRPWLVDDSEADALISLACGAVSRTHGAFLEIDASLDDRPDDSQRHTGSATPLARWDAARVSEPLRALWLQMRTRLEIVDRNRDGKSMRDSDSSPGTIHPDRGEIDCDGVWRFPFHEAPALRVPPPAGATGRVRWFALEPARAAYDLMPETGLGKGFSESPGRWIYEARRSLGVTGDYALAAEKWRPDGPGRVRVAAEVETARGWMPVAPIELRLADGAGFRGALTECFRMPYVFGIAGMAEHDLTGVETGWGSDCANFLIHAWRRNGKPLAWGDPGRLRAQLATKVEHITLADAPDINAGEIGQGIAIDFGQHVAAVWEDREPVGILGGNDLVVHHLGGFPEIVELAHLTKTRPVFSLRVPRPPSAECIVRIAGDVVMAGDGREALPGFEKQDADCFIANLEGVPSQRPPGKVPRYDFRFPEERLAWLRERGLDAVSLANNHAGDAGRDGLMEGMQALRENGIAVFGAGKNAMEACQPWRSERRGVRLAVFGVCLVESLAATDDEPGVAHLPTHAGLLAAEIRKAKAAGEKVIIMMHGGDEYHPHVNDGQRMWSRWLARHGANVIAGAHPHVVQRTECHGGTVIVHSLGNAVYPESLKGADSGEIRNFRLAVE
jgi:hypothetical protein